MPVTVEADSREQEMGPADIARMMQFSAMSGDQDSLRFYTDLQAGMASMQAKLDGAAGGADHRAVFLDAGSGMREARMAEASLAAKPAPSMQQRT